MPKKNNNTHNHGKNQKYGPKGLHNDLEYSQYTRVYQIESDNVQSDKPLIRYLNVDKILKIPTYRSIY